MNQLALSQAQQQDLSGSNFVVTGVSVAGIGYEVAKALLLAGARVIGSSRDSNCHASFVADIGAQAAERLTIFPLALDDFSSVKQFIQSVQDCLLATKQSALQGLVNNAGIHLDLLSKWKTPTLSDDGFETHWRVNYLGTMQLTLGLLPLLQAGAQVGEARVVNTVSRLYQRGENRYLLDRADLALEPYNSWVAYGNSKRALVHMTRYMQQQYGQQHLQFYCLHPGAVYTKIAGKGLAESRWISCVRNALAFIERRSLKTPAQGAQTSLYCLLEPKLEGGRYFERCRPMALDDDLADDDLADRLWQQTQQQLAEFELAVSGA